MILLIISVVVMFSAIIIYGVQCKPKRYTPRISIRHVKLRKAQERNEDLEEEQDELDFLLFEDEC